MDCTVVTRVPPTAAIPFQWASPRLYMEVETNVNIVLCINYNTVSAKYHTR